MNLDLARHLREFAQTVALNQGRVYVVGGAVRDGLLGRDTQDVDVEVHGLDARALRLLVQGHFPSVQEQGQAFGILRASIEGQAVDISLPRTDSKVAQGHTGFDVRIDPHMGVAQASRRRDFTINAMLQDVLTGEVIDPVGGREDLDAGILRMVDPETFGDDPLRVLRAVQFVGRFDLQVEPATLARLVSMVPALAELSLDRKRDEWRKVFTKAVHPSRSLELAREIGVYETMQQVIEAMEETLQDPVWHPEGSVWRHTCWGADEVAALAKREGLSEHECVVVHLANLCHDIAKPEKTHVRDGHVRSSGHAEAGVRQVRPLLTLMGFESLSPLVEPLVRHHHAPMLLKQRALQGEDTHARVRAVARELEPATCLLLSLVSGADLASRGPYPETMDRGTYAPETAQWFARQAAEAGCLQTPPPDVLTGSDLMRIGLQPGPLFGVLVHAGNSLADIHGWSREALLSAFSSADWTGVSTKEEALARVLDRHLPRVGDES